MFYKTGHAKFPSFTGDSHVSDATPGHDPQCGKDINICDGSTIYLCRARGSLPVSMSAGSPLPPRADIPACRRSPGVSGTDLPLRADIPTCRKTPGVLGTE